MTRASDIRTVKHLTKVIEAGEEQVEHAKWERAELLWTLNKTHKMQQRDIAAETKIKIDAVSVAVQMWTRFGSLARENRPTYAEANYQVAGRGPGFGNSTPKIVENFQSLPAKAKRQIVKDALMDDPDVFQDKGVQHAAAQSVSAAMKPREGSHGPRYSPSLGERAVEKGVEFAALLEEAIGVGLTEAEAKEVDEVIASILDLLREVTV